MKSKIKNYATLIMGLLLLAVSLYLNPHARTLGTTINETVQTAGY